MNQKQALAFLRNRGFTIGRFFHTGQEDEWVRTLATVTPPYSWLSGFREDRFGGTAEDVLGAMKGSELAELAHYIAAMESQGDEKAGAR